MPDSVLSKVILLTSFRKILSDVEAGQMHERFLPTFFLRRIYLKLSYFASLVD